MSDFSLFCWSGRCVSCCCGIEVGRGGGFFLAGRGVLLAVFTVGVLVLGFLALGGGGCCFLVGGQWGVCVWGGVRYEGSSFLGVVYLCLLFGWGLVCFVWVVWVGACWVFALLCGIQLCVLCPSFLVSVFGQSLRVWPSVRWGVVFGGGLLEAFMVGFFGGC